MSGNVYIFILGTLTGSGFMLFLGLAISMIIAFKMDLLNLESDPAMIWGLFGLLGIALFGLVSYQFNLETLCLYPIEGHRQCY